VSPVPLECEQAGTCNLTSSPVPKEAIEQQPQDPLKQPAEPLRARRRRLLLRLLLLEHLLVLFWTLALLAGRLLRLSRLFSLPPWQPGRFVSLIWLVGLVVVPLG